MNALTRWLIPALFTLACTTAWAAPVKVLMQTNKGDILLQLNQEKAPESVANFLRYVDSGFYDGTIFHRVIKGFMIQGGGYTPDMVRKETGEPVQNEADNGLKNVRGSIAMARTNAPHSATSQFFINHVNNSNLDYPGHDGWGYAVFGKVISGMEVVDAIATTPTGRHGAMRNVPRETIVIQSMRRAD
jgi:cyclophilin family peptidyl-prolyl cis-trans isomerase